MAVPHLIAHHHGEGAQEPGNNGLCGSAAGLGAYFILATKPSMLRLQATTMFCTPVKPEISSFDCNFRRFFRDDEPNPLRKLMFSQRLRGNERQTDYCKKVT
jgi:hypothetical protein